MKLSKLLRVALGATVALGLTAGAAQAEYPEKPITLVLPLGAGGSHDLNSRVFTSIIPQYLENAMIVKLMPGASGQTGTAAVAKAKPDGYTLLFTHNFFDQLQQHVTKLPYTPDDFETVVRLNYAVPSIVVLASSPYKTLKDMLDFGKANPNTLKFGHSGNWGAVMVPGALLLSEAGVQATLIPHKGGGPTMKALLSGDVDFTMAFPSVIGAQGDKLRVLASLGTERTYKDVPTLKELGYTPSVGLMNRVVLAPKGMPADRMKKLRDAFTAMQKDKTYGSMMKKLGENTELMQGPEYEGERMEQSKNYEKLVKAITSK
ncbi:MAG: tripartite tricarboxylate transporter substrate binding protein [Rhodospirillales bacterium]|nr:tripartite tricarboxylate transporter substrate binding protein [Rhodospirillales bacterium]